MISFDRLKRKWLRFQLEDAASVSVEFVMMAPLMVWAFISTLQFFDAYRAELISTKAAVTIADLYSREDQPITPDYLNGTRDLLQFLTLAEESPDFRVTVFFWRDVQEDYVVAWARNRGGHDTLNDNDLNALAGRLPKLADQERAILIETWTDYNPRYYRGSIPLVGDTSLDALELSAFIVTSPRFTPTLCWQQVASDTPTC